MSGNEVRIDQAGVFSVASNAVNTASQLRFREQHNPGWVRWSCDGGV